MAWVTPHTWSPTELVTAANMNGITSSLDVLGGTSWQTYIPVWGGTVTDPDLGNGSIAGYYLLTGGWCEVEIILTVGSSTTVGSGAYTITLPTGGTAASSAYGVLGTGLFFDSSGTSPTNIFAQVAYRATTGSGTKVTMTGDGARWSATTPAVPATGDVISMKLRYRI